MSFRLEPGPSDPPSLERASAAALIARAACGTLLLSFAAAAAAAPELKLSIAALRHPALSAEGVELALGGRLGAGALLGFRRLEIQGRVVDQAQLRCMSFEYLPPRLSCGRGQLTAAGLPEPLALDFEFDLARQTGELRVHAAPGARVALQVKPRGTATLAIEALPLTRVLAWVPTTAGWQGEGLVSAQAEYRQGRLDFKLTLARGGFSNADGSRAGETLALQVSGSRRAVGGEDLWTASGAWEQGAIFWQPFFVPAGARFEAAGRIAASGASSFELALAAEGLGALKARGRGERFAELPQDLRLELDDVDLAILGPRFLGPWLDPASPEAWRFGGRFDARVELRDGRLSEFSAPLESLSLANEARAIRAGPLSGVLNWRRDELVESRLRVDGATWRKLEFGAFDLGLTARGSEVTLSGTRIPLFDGALVIERASFSGDQGEGASATAAGFIEPLSLQQLSGALGLPSMSGVLSASLPGLQYRGGELTLDGALVIGVFNGYVQATELRVVEPLGAFPRVQARLEARQLDLGLLTDTFSFGNVSGRIDADVHHLELAAWRPIAFDARIASSPGEYPRRISQRAVQNISSLGGAGAVAAIQRSLLGFFDTFGYRRLGLSCRLQGGVCEMAGLPDGARGAGFLIVEGGGVPALNVIGYNRRVDWDELITRLAAVIASNAAPEVR